MRIQFSLPATLAILALWLAPLQAQTMDPAYSGSYSITNLGSVAGVPTNYGGIAFSAANANIILLGGVANDPSGRFYSIPVVRGTGSHIVSFGSPTATGFGTENDGGIAYGPGGVLFYAEYPDGNVGEVKPGSNADNKTVSLSGLGFSGSPGPLNFVPPGFNGAGQLKIASFDTGDFYTVSYSADGSGTYNLTSAAVQVTLDGGPEGIIYVPAGSASFPSQSMLVAEYNNGQISSYTIDSNGNPVLASRHAFVTGLTGAEGSVIDPVTGDLLFSTFGGSSQVIEVRGFAIPTATSFTFSGPTGGALNTASSNFTVTPNAAYTGTISITPSGGGLSAAIVLTFSNSSVAQTFTLTPTAVGPVTLTPSNSGSLTNPSTLSYATPPSAPTIGTATAGNGSASVAFTAPAGAGVSAITLYTATCISGNITGTAASSPITVTGLANGTAYTCSVTATNAAGTSAASSASNPVTPVAPPTSFTFSGPTGGALNTASSNFTVTPNAAYTGTISITPSGGGLSAAIVLTFSNSSVAQTFTLTPTAVGPVTLTPSNNGSLTNPSTLSYATPSSAPTIGTATAGNGSASVAFTAPAGAGVSAITLYTATCISGNITGTAASSPITVTGLANGTAYTCSVTATNAAGTSAASSASN